MHLVSLFAQDGFEFVVAPDDEDPRIEKALQESVGATFNRKERRARRALLERYLRFAWRKGEHWTAALLDTDRELRERAASWAETDLELTVKPDTNLNWKTWSVGRKDGPVDHYMLAFTTLRKFFARLIDSGYRPRGSQNPFERDNWHTDSDESKWLYCVRRYGVKAPTVFRYAGAFFLPLARRPRNRSTFNPRGVGARIVAAMRERSPGHVATNMMEVIGDDPARFDDINDCDATHWPDFGDTLLARNKAGGDEYDKEVVIDPETVAGMHARIDRDHEADPSRPSMAMLRAWAAAGEHDRLAAFKLFQKHPDRGDGPLHYNSFWELLHKACVKHDVTVGRGAAKRYASSKWPRREKVDGRMLEVLRAAKTRDDLDHGKEEIRQEMGWKTDQSGTYGSSAVATVASDRKRDQMRKKKEERERAASGDAPRLEPSSSSPRVQVAIASAMRRKAA